MSAVSPVTAAATTAQPIHFLPIVQSPCAPFASCLHPNGTCETHFILIPMQNLEWGPRPLAASGPLPRRNPLPACSLQSAWLPSDGDIHASQRPPYYADRRADRRNLDSHHAAHLEFRGGHLSHCDWSRGPQRHPSLHQVMP